MTDTTENAAKMQDLQKMRIAIIMMLSEENSKLMSRRQKVAGKEIEVMTAERDMAEGQPSPGRDAALERLYKEDRIVREAAAETERDIEKMEQTLAKIDADIAALCQA
ncbi:MAG: hypothetical protein WBH04_13280 [Albidovulum sp.]